MLGTWDADQSRLEPTIPIVGMRKTGLVLWVSASLVKGKPLSVVGHAEKDHRNGQKKMLRRSCSHSTAPQARERPNSAMESRFP